MAVDIFAKIDGIKGESLDDRHKDEVEVLSWSWGVTQSGSITLGGGGGAGKATFNDFSFTHHLDKASPNLLKACATGEHIKEATITMRKAGKGQQEFLIIKMNDIIITGVQPSGTREGRRHRRTGRDAVRQGRSGIQAAEGRRVTRCRHPFQVRHPEEQGRVATALSAWTKRSGSHALSAIAPGFCFPAEPAARRRWPNMCLRSSITVCCRRVSPQAGCNTNTNTDRRYPRSGSNTDSSESQRSPPDGHDNISLELSRTRAWPSGRRQPSTVCGTSILEGRAPWFCDSVRGRGKNRCPCVGLCPLHGAWNTASRVPPVRWRANRTSADHLTAAPL